MSKATKFCVLPGQAPVRVAKLDGRVILIGETPREVPEDMQGDAISKGATTEEALATLKKRLAAPATPAKSQAEIDAEIAAALVGKDAATTGTRESQILQATLAVIAKADPFECIGSGAPKVPVLEDILKFDITAVERDAAYAEATKSE